MRELLIERFGIQAHMEERPGTAYNLEAVSPKLIPANPAGRTQCARGPAPGEKDPRFTTPILDTVFHCQNITLAEFGRQLPSLAYGEIHTPVLDHTGLDGRYDFTLSFTSEDRLQSRSADSAGGNGGSLAPGDPNGALSLDDAGNPPPTERLRPDCILKLV
jgi:uncharacterized protein (TIGR03435 family)